MNISSIGSNSIPTGTQAPVAAAANTFRAPSSTENGISSPATSQDSAPTGKVTNEQVESSVKALKDLASSLNSNLEFSIDRDTGRTVVKVMDAATQEVIKQIPSEEILSVAKAIDQLKGIFIQQKA